MITTDKADEYVGYTAIDHHSSPNLFEMFLMKQRIDPFSFVGIDTYFPTPPNHNKNMRLKILFKFEGELKAKNVEIGLQDFLNLFVTFRIAFAPKNHLDEVVKSIDFIEEFVDNID